MSATSKRIALLSLLLALTACASDEYCEDELAPAPLVAAAPQPAAAPSYAPPAAMPAPAPVAVQPAPAAAPAPSFASAPAPAAKAAPVPAAAPVAKAAPAPAIAAAPAPAAAPVSAIPNDKPLIIIRFSEKKRVDFKNELKQVIGNAQQSNPNTHYTIVSYVPLGSNSKENSRQSSLALDNQSELTYEMAKLGVPASRITLRSRYTAAAGTPEQEAQIFAQ